ncbi:TolB protein [Marinitoga hydrogenitolerans DSM 16785]|uniref:TolB protein n=1 Tax=Marinitoga hydrogenitolerans (strain DSM 16785 / JCM 12826 / AT1271) TaxID=1122195 RepID=A0A1M5AE45_MARH1|nr:PD40 domain-containing protein [Marinitoga hydrogenitolerans]SHF28366.1 TolB protein [Marinitoga hydrogenitolerans DSM 16785]
MKKKLLFSFFIVIIIFVFSQIKINKETVMLKQNSNSWIMTQIINEFENKLFYSYNVYKYNNEDENNNLNYDILLEFSEDASKNSIRILATFDGTMLDLSEKIKDNDKWIKSFTIKTLEKISFKRLMHSNNWNFLQVTYWDGVDEYPIISPDGNKILFISDRYIGNRNIWGYDFKSNKYINISLNFSSEYFPNITEDGTYIFQSSLYGKWDVLMYNPETNEIKRISDDSYNAYTPYYYNGNIYFSAEERNGESWTEIYKYVIKEDRIEKITSLKSTFKFRPTIFKNAVLFQMINPKNGQNGIYIFKDNKIKPFISSEFNEVDPISFKNYILYSKLKDGYYRITMYNTETKEEIPLTTTIYDDAFYPFAYNNFILFSLYYKNGEPDIFAIRLP